MRKRFFSVMIVPHDHKRVFSVKMPSWINCLLLCIFIILVFGTWIFTMKFQELRSENTELREWKQVYSEQVERLMNHAKEVEYLKKEVMGIKRLEGKVKNLSTELKMSNLPSPPLPSVPIRLLDTLGKGGPDLRLEKNYPSYPELQNKVEKSINDLKKDVNVGKVSLSDLKEFLEKQLSVARVTPNRWPLRGWITSRYGWRVFRGQEEFHSGIDIASYEGAPIRAAADGNVMFSGWRGEGYSGYGRLIILDHGRGLQTYYGHNSANLVSNGEFVKKGQVIGRVGSTGHATGPHLHYELRINGNTVSPFKYLY